MKRSYLLKILPYIRPERRRIFCSLAASLLMNLFAVSITWQFSRAIERYVPAEDLTGLLRAGGRILLCAVLYFGCYVLFLHQARSAQYQVQHRLRRLVFSHVLNCRYEYFVQKSFGQVNTNIIQDVEAFCDGIFNKAFGSIANILFFVTTFAILIAANLRITAVLLTYMAAVTVYMYALKRVMVRFTKEYSSSKARLNESIMDLTAHGKSIVLYECQERYLKRTDQYNKAMNRNWLKLNVFSPLIQSSIEVSILVSYLLAFWVCWIELRAGRAGYADLFLYLTYIPQLWNKYGSAIDIMAELSKGEVYAQRILGAVEQETTEGEVSSDVQNQPLLLEETGIEITGLWFSFAPETPVWQNFSADFRKPGLYGISGPSGCGKSTLFDILMGFYRPEKGKIEICGIPMEEYSFGELRRTVGIVHQEPYFVSGTILENICFFADNITEEQITDCVREYGLESHWAQLESFGTKNLGRADPGLTTGQRRIISLLRVLARRPRVLLCDEITAGLDSHTEELVLNMIRRFSKAHTCLLISHKDSDLESVKNVIRL